MGFDIHSAFGINKSQADKGSKKMLGADPEEYITLRHIPNADYRAMLTKEHRANAKILEFAKPEDANELSDKIMAKVLASTCVTGWGKKLAVKGKVVPFSVDKCIELFVEYPKFRADCQAFAEDISNFQEGIKEDLEDVKK